MTDESEPLDPKTLADECDAALKIAKPDQFYGPSGTMALGAGLIVTNVPYPLYLPHEQVYGTATGTAVIVTHECDIDIENVRPFNTQALIIPLIPITSIVKMFSGKSSVKETRDLVLNVASGYTHRLTYLPRLGSADEPLYTGAILDLNFMTSCGINALAAAKAVCSLTDYGISILDRALQNHLFREKSDTVPRAV